MKSSIQNKAFSLIELMVVIAIVAVLSAIAVPLFKSYLARGKAAEIIKSAEASMSNWLLANQANEPLPAATGPIGNHIQTIVVDGTGVSILLNSPSTIDPILSGATVQYTPTVSSSNVITWECSVLVSGGASYNTTTTQPAPGAGGTWGGYSTSFTLYFQQNVNNHPGGAPTVSTEATKLVCG